MTAPVIGFVGMTHLGLVSATGTCSKGFAVLGVDADTALIARISAGDLPVLEPGLPEMIADNGDRQAFSADFADLARCDVVYIAADVPTDDEGASDLSGILALIDRVIPCLGVDAVLVVLCQVPPGFSRGVALAPERLFYQVETLIFGRAVERATEPERFIVGCADPGRPLPPAYGDVLDAFGCPILTMRYESAELAKIAINVCLVASVSVANTLAELSENIGADWHEIAPALKLDRRVGPYAYLAPGLGIAGGNLERDLATVIRLAGEWGSDPGVIEAFVRNSRRRRDWALRVLERHVFPRNPDPLIALLGLAYKQDTHSTKNSPGLALARALAGRRLRVHDPAVHEADGLRAEETALAAIEGADVLVVMTPWDEYKALDPAAVKARLAGNWVIDPYGVFDAHMMADLGVNYATLGRPIMLAAT